MYEFEDNTIVICNNKYKEEILKFYSFSKKLINIKFFSMKELFDKYYFSYDTDTFYYLMKKYNYKENVCKLYLDNLLYGRKSDNKKLQFLYDLKCELDENNLLIYDDLFKSFLTGKNIVFVGFKYLKKEELTLIDILKKNNNVSIINNSYNNHEHFVYESDTLENEVIFVCNKIVSLILDGVDIKNIKLLNVDSDYFNTINRVFSYYDLAIKQSNNLYNTVLAKQFLNDFNTFFDVSIYKDKFDVELINKLVNILNKYVSYTDLDIVKELVINDLKNTIISDSYSNMISVIDFDDIVTDDDYVFMMNFNLNKIPKTYKDDDYLSDEIKDKIGIDTATNLNIKEKKFITSYISNVKNLFISYKLSSFYGKFYKSNLVSDLGLEVKTISNDLNVSYSDTISLINLTKRLDNLIKYGVHDSYLDVLYNNFKDVPYNTYNNKYSIIDKDKMYKYLDGKLSLSYSSMSDFYKCSFKYYLSSILKLNIYEDNFNTYLGSLFHYAFEVGLNKDIDIDRIVSSFIEENERELSNKEMFFIDILKPEIEFVLNSIKDNMRFTKLDQAFYENRIEVIKKSILNVTFKGFIDKLMYKVYPDKTIVSIIDYKTGDTPSDLKLSKYGLNLQLPVYLYLANNDSRIHNPSFAGFYIKQVLNKKFSFDKNKSFIDAKKDLLKLHGYSNIDTSILKEFDSSYADSNLVKSLKVTNSGGFYSYSKVISDSQINSLINLVDDLINNAIKEIESANFTINPKKTIKGNIACGFCKFKEICYMNPSDEVLIEEENDLSFLGGDIDA